MGYFAPSESSLRQARADYNANSSHYKNIIASSMLDGKLSLSERAAFQRTRNFDANNGVSMKSSGFGGGGIADEYYGFNSNTDAFSTLDAASKAYSKGDNRVTGGAGSTGYKRPKNSHGTKTAGGVLRL